MREKYYLYLVNYSVIGSNKGSLDYPKFHLLNLFQNYIFPRIDLRGDYEGY